MFVKRDDRSLFTDLSLSARDLTDWKIGILKDSEFPLDITTIAFDPVSRLLAIGTAQGVIHLHGGPGVETKLLLPVAVPVRFLQFGQLSERLVCLDSGDHLHIWDLSSLGSPKHMAMVRWDPTTFMALSPSHNHIFIALTNGELKTYDLACMRKSPYTLPNMWRLYEAQMLRSGLSLIPTQNPGRQPIELLFHPRNLGLLFIAYEDGVALVDLKERKSIRNFELVLPPGVPGGAGYGSQDILLPRRSSVTCVTIHPSGHFFAIGHTDGTIAFWALEDSEQPVLVRTLDDLDVNTTDPEMLEGQLGDAAGNNTSTLREPIFKLSWSGFSNTKDPRGGETALTILGGTKPDKGLGLNVLWFPPFNPGDPSATSPSTDQDGLHPFMITAIRRSLKEANSFFYSTNTLVQDFYLIPRESPHFNCTYDPYAILILSEAGQDGRFLESREFPPPIFTSAGNPSGAKASPAEESGLHALDIALESLSFNSHPQIVGLPYEFSGGGFMADGYRVHVVPKEVYAETVEAPESTSKRPRVRLSAGCALVEPSLEAKRTKYQPRRVLVCPNRNLTISFYDISAQLLQVPDNSPLLHDFPESIDPLEIDLRPALDVIDSQRLVDDADGSTRSIIATHFAARTLECAIALSTGEVLVYRPNSTSAAQRINEAHDAELLLLKHIIVEPWRKLAPYFVLRGVRAGPILSLAISEIGFIAVAYTDGSLLVVDMRGPTVLHRPTRSTRRSSRSSKHSFRFHHLTESSSDADAIASLTWTISGLDKDSKPLIRLITMRSSGNMEVYTITQSRSHFNFDGPITVNKAIPEPIPEGTFVISGKTGAFCKADRLRFSDMLHFNDQEGDPVVLVTSGMKGVRSFMNITGERIGKAEWSTKFGDVIGVQIIERLGSRVFVAYTNKSALHVYSLPDLEHIHTIPALATPLRSISIDETGDFVSFNVQPSSGLVQSTIYGTLFNFRRTEELPLIDLIGNKGKLPSQPQLVPIGPSSFRSWFQFSQTLTGQQIDELLGGLDRPPPVKRARDVVSQREGIMPGGPSASSAASLVASAAAVQSSIYNRLTTSLNERGQMLGDLEENIKSLEEGSKDMLSQAKRLAAQNSAKSWFGF